MKTPGKITVVLALFLLLAACGGGGGGSDPDPEPLTECRLGASTIGDCKL